ncbi:MAG: hypothetical protein M1828_000403 [Chrysothrix sp. TS-e1954]|nr:MAG: hypothetical protein M1828_000403 [Chrysothrix sp. TS-e1954]
MVPVNGLRQKVMDGSGTINPAELGSSLTAPTHLSTLRGTKRSRSPDKRHGATLDEGADYGTGNTAESVFAITKFAHRLADDFKPRKRGRPSKIKGEAGSSINSQTSAALATPKKTPQPETRITTRASPTQSSPPKSGAGNKSVKALPTVRDHTSDQLTAEGDEYEARDFDDAGEEKVTPTGHLTGGREYRCKTFFIPNRGDRLFMLATECARVLQYRDSYLLFNKNKSLFKIIANQPEKDHLIAQELLPFSYRSRQIAIVSARSMYRQFGARVIVNGRRVRDDYFEAKARKQGFTEEDLASEKRPGVTTVKKEPTVDSTTTLNNAMSFLAGNRIAYDENAIINPYLADSTFEPFAALAPNTLPMIMPDESQTRDYGNVQRPRQDITGTPYQDRTQSSSSNEIISQAAQIAEFNKNVTQQRQLRGQFLQDHWNREHKIQTPEPQQPAEQPSPNEEPSHQRRHSATHYQNARRASQSLSQSSPQQSRPHVPLSNASAAGSPTAFRQQQQQDYQNQSIMPSHPQMMTPQEAYARQQQQRQQAITSPSAQRSMNLPPHQQAQLAQYQQRQQQQQGHPYANAAAASPSPHPSGIPYQYNMQYAQQQAAQSGMWPPPHPSASSPITSHHPHQQPNQSPYGNAPQQSPHMQNQSPHPHPQQQQQHPAMNPYVNPSSIFAQQQRMAASGGMYPGGYMGEQTPGQAGQGSSGGSASMQAWAQSQGQQQGMGGAPFGY